MTESKWWSSLVPPHPQSLLPCASSLRLTCTLGRNNMDGQKIAEEASQRLDMRIQVEEVSLDRIKEILRRNMKKSHEAVIELIVEIFELISEGKMDKQTDDLKKLLGTDPMSVADFFEKNQREFKP